MKRVLTQQLAKIQEDMDKFQYAIVRVDRMEALETYWVIVDEMRKALEAIRADGGYNEN